MNTVILDPTSTPKFCILVKENQKLDLPRCEMIQEDHKNEQNALDNEKPISLSRACWVSLGDSFVGHNIVPLEAFLPGVLALVGFAIQAT